MRRKSLDQVSRCESSPGRAQQQLVHRISGLELREHCSAQLCSQIREDIGLRASLPAALWVQTVGPTSGVDHGIIWVGKETSQALK